jgi:hypothetical protein
MPDKRDTPKKSTVAPNPALGFWREMGQDLVKGSVKSTEEAGKQIIAGASILEALYFHAITYSDLRGNLTGWQVVVYLVPIVLWLASLWFAVSIFYPRFYTMNISSSDVCKQAYEEITVRKFGQFRAAAIFLGLGVLGLLPALALYLLN